LKTNHHYIKILLRLVLTTYNEKTLKNIDQSIRFAASSPPLGAILSALVAGLVLQKYGRKVTLMLSVSVTCFAFILLGTAKIYEIPAVMIASRALMGITVGFCMPSATIYVSFKTTFF